MPNIMGITATWALTLHWYLICPYLEKGITISVDTGNPRAIELYALTMRPTNEHEMLVEMREMLLEAAEENDAYSQYIIG